MSVLMAPLVERGLLAGNPVFGAFECLGRVQKIAVAEAVGVLPLVAVLVGTLERDAVEAGVVFPHGSGDIADAELSRWLFAFVHLTLHLIKNYVFVPDPAPGGSHQLSGWSTTAAETREPWSYFEEENL